MSDHLDVSSHRFLSPRASASEILEVPLCLLPAADDFWWRRKVSGKGWEEMECSTSDEKQQ